MTAFAPMFQLSRGFFATLLTALIFASHAAAQGEDQAVILQYHHVSTATPAATSLSPADFAAHLSYLERNGFTASPLEEVIAALQSNASLPDKTVSITFDDGYISVYEAAFPLLREYGWPFTIFVATGLVGSNARLYLDWEKINEMAASGATIANHTVSHPYLLHQGSDESDGQWEQRVTAEILQAESQLLAQTGQSRKLLAYPYGEYSPRLQQLVSELGFAGIAQHSGPINANSDFTALPRFPFSGAYASMDSFPVKVSSLAFNAELASPPSPVTRLAAPSALLRFGLDNPELARLACYNNGEPISVAAENREERLYRVATHLNNQSRRFRYNCTAPGPAGRYYWLSIPWVNPELRE